MKKIKVKTKIGRLEIDELVYLLKKNPDSIILKKILRDISRQANKQANNAACISDAVPDIKDS